MLSRSRGNLPLKTLTDLFVFMSNNTTPKPTDLEVGLTSESSAVGTSIAPGTGLENDGISTLSSYGSSLEFESDDLGSDKAWDSDDGLHHVSDDGPAVRHCACFPDGETGEQCKARIARIVEKQKRCYGKPSIDRD
jgi:hypothetical protein